MAVRSWIAGFAAITSVLVAGVFFHAEEELPDRSVGPVSPTPCSGDPVAISEVIASAPFEVVQPNALVASPGTLTDVWRCPGGGVALRYRSGVGIVESFNDLADPEATWNRMASLYAEFSVGQIDGIPVSLADPAVGGAIGGVDLVVDGIRYTVSGNAKIPLDALVDVARSMPIPRSQST